MQFFRTASESLTTSSVLLTIYLAFEHRPVCPPREAMRCSLQNHFMIFPFGRT